MKGDRTRQSILEHAVDISSVEGLEGLTIGRLADDLGMSKSGLFAHFGSKEDLQLVWCLRNSLPVAGGACGRDARSEEEAMW